MPTRRSRTFELSPIKEIEIAAARVAGAVSLAQGIPDFDTPAVIKDYVIEKMAAGEAARYSLAPGLQELREQVAESLAKEGMHYDPDGEILITAGAIEAIAATLFALTEPGQEVIIPSPSYASYQRPSPGRSRRAPQPFSSATPTTPPARFTPASNLWN